MFGIGISVAESVLWLRNGLLAIKFIALKTAPQLVDLANFTYAGQYRVGSYLVKEIAWNQPLTRAEVKLKRGTESVPH